MTNTYVEQWFLVFKLIGILMALAVGGMLTYVIYYYVFQGLLAPTRRVMARVLYKKQNEIEVDLPTSSSPYARLSNALSLVLDRNDDTPVYHSWDYYVTFEFQGRRQEFSVSEEVYSSVSEGDSGLLVYKGNLFRDFIPYTA